MIYEDHKLIQVAIPKTGTSCIFSMIHNLPKAIAEARILTKLNIKRTDPLFEYYRHAHHTHREYENMIDNYPKYKNYKFFTFVRNPYDIIVSEYMSRGHAVRRAFCAALINSDGRKIDPTEMEIPSEELVVTQTFKQFCYSELVEKKWIAQVDYLKNRDGNIEMNFIGKLENFEKDWNELKDLFPTLPEYNTKYRQNNMSHKRKLLNNPTEFSELYDLETKNLVLKYFEEDFDTFNYKKAFSIPSSFFRFPATYFENPKSA
jgi:hypothetical protein